MDSASQLCWAKCKWFTLFETQCPFSYCVIRVRRLLSFYDHCKDWMCEIISLVAGTLKVYVLTISCCCYCFCCYFVTCPAYGDGLMNQDIWKQTVPKRRQPSFLGTEEAWKEAVGTQGAAAAAACILQLWSLWGSHMVALLHNSILVLGVSSAHRGAGCLQRGYGIFTGLLLKWKSDTGLFDARAWSASCRGPFV